MNIRTLSKGILTAFFAIVAFNASSQDNIEKLLEQSVEDSKLVVGEYISPFMKSVSLGLNQGWYNTAKPHKVLGFDLTVTTSMMVIPDDESTFNVGNLNLQTISLSQDSPGYPNAPTVFGKDEAPVFQVNGTNEVIPGLPGAGIEDKIGKNWMPVPMAHVAIGLPKGFELKVRFVPAIDLNGNGDFKMWGVGVMHDVKQHIPGLKLLPFDLSAFAGFTKMDLVYNIDQQEVAGANQRAEMRMTATTIQGIISKKFSILTVYGGAGFNIATSKMGILGTYDLNGDGDFSDASEVDPLDFKYNASGVRATAGFRIKLAVLTLHADYTFQKYNAITAGVGINVR